MRYAYLQKKKGRIDLISQGEVENWEALKNKFGDRVSLAICLNTDKVLTRSVSGPNNIDPIIQSALPNVDTSSILVSALPGTDSHGVGLIRRDSVEELLQTAHSFGFRITTWVIGPWSLMNLAHLIEQKDTISYGGWELTNKNGCIEAHKNSVKPDLDLVGLQVNGEHVLAFSVAWQHLVGAVEIISNTNSITHTDVQEETARVRYEMGIVISVTLLVLLFISQLLVSNHLDGKEGSLNTSLAAHRSLQQEVQQLKNDANSKKQLVSSLGIDQKNMLTLSAWEVLQAVPKGIRLDKLIINPMKKITKNKPIQTELGLIRVAGTCKDTKEVNNWMNMIRESELFSSVRLLSYSLDEGVPNFEIEIKT